MSLPETEFTQKRARTYQGLVTALTKKTAKSKLGSQFTPLFKIALDHVVIDELHLFLRIFDILLRNIIYMALKCDQEHQVDTSLTALKKTIRECGVSFAIWQQQEGREKGYKWTSLPGRDKKRLIKVKAIQFSAPRDLHAV